MTRIPLHKRPKQNGCNEPSKYADVEVTSSLHHNITNLEAVFHHSSDIVFREFLVGEQQIRSYIVYIQGMTDEKTVNEYILDPLMRLHRIYVDEPSMTVIAKYFIRTGETNELSTLAELIDALLEGNTVLLMEGVPKALGIGTQGFPSRDVTEPETESVVRGPRESFTENLNDNIALIRRRVKTSDLIMDKLIIGRITKTKVTLAYIYGVVDEKLIQEVRDRLNRIDVDSVLDSSYIEELIEDNPYSLFPQVESTERPDKVAAGILEGRVAILVDGTPFTLMAPALMIQFLQSSEDYYQRYPFTTAVRFIRYLFFIIALLLPSTFVAVTTFHHEMMPTPLLISFTSAHQGVPFPTVVEAFIMEVTFEALREAGVRLPRTVGQAISIVGALVIGQAAVEAGIVSPAMVIVVALTAIASFSIPAYSLGFAIRLLRFGFLLLGAVLGFYGILLGLLGLMIHVTSLRSFGVPYLTPVAPFKIQDMKDVIMRAPWWNMTTRPSLFGMNNRRRQKFFLKPRPPKQNQ